MEDNIQTNNLKSFISLLINCFLILIITIMPFVVFPKGTYYYVETKAIFLYVAALFIFILMIINKKIPFRKEYLICSFFILSIFIPSILSNYKKVAFLGNAERHEGFLMYVVYITLFIAASKYLKINKYILNFIIICGSIMSIYSILQMFQIDPIQRLLYGSIITPDGVNGTIGSITTIGNYNFVSTYLSMFLFLSISLFIFKKKNIYIIPSIIIFLGLLSTRTRGGWVSFIIVALVGLIYIINNRTYLLRTFILFLVFINSVFILNTFSGNKILERAKIDNIINFSSSDNLINNDLICSLPNTKLNNIFSENEENTDSNSFNLVGSASSRANIYKIGLKAFLDSPFLGEGPDTFNYRLNADYKQDLTNHINKYNESIDKLHNEYLEYAVCDGIGTLILYLILILTILFKLIKRMENTEVKIVFFILLSYLVQAFLNISVIMVAPLFWIVLGYSVQLIYKDNVKYKIENV